MFHIKLQRKMNHIFDAQYPFSISIVVTEIINQKDVNKLNCWLCVYLLTFFMAEERCKPTERCK
jgi:hypothetical protein